MLFYEFIGFFKLIKLCQDVFYDIFGKPRSGTAIAAYIYEILIVCFWKYWFYSYILLIRALNLFLFIIFLRAM